MSNALSRLLPGRRTVPSTHGPLLAVRLARLAFGEGGEYSEVERPEPLQFTLWCRLSLIQKQAGAKHSKASRSCPIAKWPGPFFAFALFRTARFVRNVPR